VINSLHAGYSFPEGSQTKRMFPDYLFVFGEYWMNSAKYPINRNHIINVGFPYMEIQKEKYENVKKTNQIIFLSQDFIGQPMANFAIELDKLTGQQYNVVYKLHPREYEGWSENYPQFEDTEIRVIDTSEIPLYKLFAESIAQIGVSSTAIYEGLAFGLPTYLMDLPGVEYFKDLIDSKIASIVSSPPELMERLEKDEKSIPFDTEHFFQSNAIQNIQSAIRKLLGTK
jgi:hypothetical protein